MTAVTSHNSWKKEEEDEKKKEEEEETKKIDDKEYTVSCSYFRAIIYQAVADPISTDCSVGQNYACKRKCINYKFLIMDIYSY